MELPNLKLDRREIIVLARLATAEDESAFDTARVPSGDLFHQDVVLVYWHTTEAMPTIVDHCVRCHWQLVFTD